MRPDDTRALVVRIEELQRFDVAMRVNVEIVLDREAHELRGTFARRRLAVNVEFADAAVIAALEFLQHHFEDRWHR